MLAYRLNSSDVKNQIFIPKYYDPELKTLLGGLSETHDLLCIGDLLDRNVLSVQTGHEIGKMAYGAGNIPFVRTSDISNWEIKTVPKQGVSDEIYLQYAEKEDVKAGDILLVKDGTYLIGTNCIITSLDTPMLYQSHILKFRVLDTDIIDPYILFISFNNNLVHRQIKNLQFTADIIDTLGRRYREIILPIPKDRVLQQELICKAKATIDTRTKYKAAIRQMPKLIEAVLDADSIKPFDDFFEKSIQEIASDLVQDTTSSEFGSFSAFPMSNHSISNNIFLPKYYDPSVSVTLKRLESNCNLLSIAEMINMGIISLSTGDEIGKMSYGTGEIPFVRTSDFSNWEIKSDAKQGVSEEIYQQYAEKEDVRPGDILVVRDGTYLVGTSCIITEPDKKMLYCGGLIKIRIEPNEIIDSYLFLGLLNSYIVKKQMRTKQFTRDVIDTMGQRFKEVIIPVPRSASLKTEISKYIQEIVEYRIKGRNILYGLAQDLTGF